jgi:hypothetical protein
MVTVAPDGFTTPTVEPSGCTSPVKMSAGPAGPVAPVAPVAPVSPERQSVGTVPFTHQPRSIWCAKYPPEHRICTIVITSLSVRFARNWWRVGQQSSGLVVGRGTFETVPLRDPKSVRELPVRRGVRSSGIPHSGRDAPFGHRHSRMVTSEFVILCSTPGDRLGRQSGNWELSTPRTGRACMGRRCRQVRS